MKTLSGKEFRKLFNRYETGFYLSAVSYTHLFVNIRILDDLFDVSVFSDYVVELETPLREWS